MPWTLVHAPLSYGRLARGIALAVVMPGILVACDGRVRPTEGAPASHLAAGITGVVADSLEGTPRLRFECRGGVPSSLVATVDASGLALEIELSVPLVAGSTVAVGAILQVDAAGEAGPRIFGLPFGPAAPQSSVTLAPAGRGAFEATFDLHLVDMVASHSESTERVRVRGRLFSSERTTCADG